MSTGGDRKWRRRAPWIGGGVVAVGLAIAIPAGGLPGGSFGTNETYQGLVNGRTGTVTLASTACQVPGTKYSEPLSLDVSVVQSGGPAGTDRSGFTPQQGSTGKKIPTAIQAAVIPSRGGTPSALLTSYGQTATLTTQFKCHPKNGIARVVFRALGSGKGRIKSSVIVLIVAPSS
jgi:hypothetical protein